MKCAVYSIALLLLFCYSCKTDKEMIAKKTEDIITAIRDSNINSVISYLHKGNPNVDEEGSIFYINMAHEYIKKYVPRGKKVSYVILGRDEIYRVLVSCPLFEGFDSSNGVKKAALELYFRPPTPNSRYSELVSIYMKQDLNFEYRWKKSK